MTSYITKRTPVIHLLTTTPAEQAEFWATIAHEVRMIGLSTLDFSRHNFAGRCDPCTGELLMVLPLSVTEDILHDAIPPVVDAWLPQWMNHIDLVCEMAVAMAKHRDEQDGVFQAFIQALKALPDMPPFQEEAAMQAASARADELLAWKNSKRWGLCNAPRRKLPWILADACWEKQLDDAFTLLHIWRQTHFIGIEFMTEGFSKPPAITCMPFPVGVLGLGLELETNLSFIERYRLNRKKNLEQNLLLMTDLLRGLRSGWSPYQLMLWASAEMSKPLDTDAVRRRINKRREKRILPANETSANAVANFLTPEEVASLSSSSVPAGTDRDINSYTQEEVDAMVADIPTEAIRELIEIVGAAFDKDSGEAANEEEFPHSDFLTPQEVVDLLAPVSEPKRKATKRKREP